MAEKNECEQTKNKSEKDNTGSNRSIESSVSLGKDAEQVQYESRPHRDQNEMVVPSNDSNTSKMDSSKEADRTDKPEAEIDSVNDDAGGKESKKEAAQRIKNKDQFIVECNSSLDTNRPVSNNCGREISQAKQGLEGHEGDSHTNTGAGSDTQVLKPAQTENKPVDATTEDYHKGISGQKVASETIIFEKQLQCKSTEDKDKDKEDMNSAKSVQLSENTAAEKDIKQTKPKISDLAKETSKHKEPICLTSSGPISKSSIGTENEVIETKTKSPSSDESDLLKTVDNDESEGKDGEKSYPSIEKSKDSSNSGSVLNTVNPVSENSQGTRTETIAFPKKQDSIVKTKDIQKSNVGTENKELIDTANALNGDKSDNLKTMKDIESKSEEQTRNHMNVARPINSRNSDSMRDMVRPDTSNYLTKSTSDHKKLSSLMETEDIQKSNTAADNKEAFENKKIPVNDNPDNLKTLENDECNVEGDKNNQDLTNPALSIDNDSIVGIKQSSITDNQASKVTADPKKQKSLVDTENIRKYFVGNENKEIIETRKKTTDDEKSEILKTSENQEPKSTDRNKNHSVLVKPSDSITSDSTRDIKHLDTTNMQVAKGIPEFKSPDSLVETEYVATSGIEAANDENVETKTKLLLSDKSVKPQPVRTEDTKNIENQKHLKSVKLEGASGQNCAINITQPNLKSSSLTKDNTEPKISGCSAESAVKQNLQAENKESEGKCINQPDPVTKLKTIIKTEAKPSPDTIIVENGIVRRVKAKPSNDRVSELKGNRGRTRANVQNDKESDLKQKDNSRTAAPDDSWGIDHGETDKAIKTRCQENEEKQSKLDQESIKTSTPKKNIKSAVQDEPEATEVADDASTVDSVSSFANLDVDKDAGDSTSTEDNEKDDELPDFSKRTAQDPNFAVVCSFLNMFGPMLNLPGWSLDEIEQALDTTTDLALTAEKHGLLEQLHLKLMRRFAKSSKSQFNSLANVSSKRLPKYLLRVAKELDLELAWDLEKFGYHILRAPERLLLLKGLCELQFDENPKFRNLLNDEYVKSEKIKSLRLQPYGRDMDGRLVWFQQDSNLCVRVYSVEEDDTDGTSWRLHASNIDELGSWIAHLKKRSEVNPKDVAFKKRLEKKAQKKALKEKKRKEEQERMKSRGRGRGRGKGKARQKRVEVVSESSSDDDDDNPCARCFSNSRPEDVLLCDKCDAAYHTLCLRPPLMTIPEGDWQCPYCDQLDLIEKIDIIYKDLKVKKKNKEKQVRRREQSGINLSNIVDKDAEDQSANGRRSIRSRKRIDYNFADFNDMISVAIRNLEKDDGKIEPVDRKDKTTDGKDEKDEEKDEAAEEKDETAEADDSPEINVSKFYGTRSKRKAPRLTDLDAEDAGSSGSDFHGGLSSSDEEDPDIADSGSVSESFKPSRYGFRRSRLIDDEDDSNSVGGFGGRRASRRSRRIRKKYGPSSGDDEESEEEPAHYVRRSTRRSAVNKSYTEFESGSEFSEDEKEAKKPKKKKRKYEDDDSSVTSGDVNEMDIDMDKEDENDETEESDLTDQEMYHKIDMGQIDGFLVDDDEEEDTAEETDEGEESMRDFGEDEDGVDIREEKKRKRRESIRRKKRRKVISSDSEGEDETKGSPVAARKRRSSGKDMKTIEREAAKAQKRLEERRKSGESGGKNMAVIEREAAKAKEKAEKEKLEREKENEDTEERGNLDKEKNNIEKDKENDRKNVKEDNADKNSSKDTNSENIAEGKQESEVINDSGKKQPVSSFGNNLTVPKKGNVKTATSPPVSPLLGMLDNAELEKMSSGDLVDSLNALNSTPPPPAKEEAPSSLAKEELPPPLVKQAFPVVKETPQGFPHGTVPGGYTRPAVPTAVYPVRPIPKSFNQPFTQFERASHPSAFSPVQMHYPYAYEKQTAQLSPQGIPYYPYRQHLMHKRQSQPNRQKNGAPTIWMPHKMDEHGDIKRPPPRGPTTSDQRMYQHMQLHGVQSPHELQQRAEEQPTGPMAFYRTPQGSMLRMPGRFQVPRTSAPKEQSSYQIARHTFTKGQMQDEQASNQIHKDPSKSHLPQTVPRYSHPQHQIPHQWHPNAPVPDTMPPQMSGHSPNTYTPLHKRTIAEIDKTSRQPRASLPSQKGIYGHVPSKTKVNISSDKHSVTRISVPKGSQPVSVHSARGQKGPAKTQERRTSGGATETYANFRNMIIAPPADTTENETNQSPETLDC